MLVVGCFELVGFGVGWLVEWCVDDVVFGEWIGG